MKPFALTSLSLTACVILTLGGGAYADELSPLSKAVSLQANGGASLNVPDWKVRRGDDAITILERTGEASRGGFTTLLLAIEEGPTSIDAIDWTKVTDNIQSAAKDAGTPLNLKPKEAGPSVTGFKTHRLVGDMTVGGRAVDLQMVALVAPGVLVTVTAIGPRGDARLETLAGAVAKTAKRPAPVP